MRLRYGLARHRSGIDGRSFSYSGLSPWDLHPHWAGCPVFVYILAEAPSSKLVRVGLKGLLLKYCCNLLIIGIKNIWRPNGVMLSCVWIKHCLTTIDVAGFSLNFYILTLSGLNDSA